MLNVGDMVQIRNKDSGEISWDPPRRVDGLAKGRATIGGHEYPVNMGMSMEWVITPETV